MTNKLEIQLRTLSKKAKADVKVLAVIVFGSYARGEKYRDIDVCLVAKGVRQPIEAARLRQRYLADFGELDVHIFQLLPLYIRVRVLKEGKILHVKDEDALYDIAFATAKEYEDFKPLYESYLEAVKHG